MIGRNVIVEGSYIWDDVVIEDNCVIDRAIICDHVVIRTGVAVQQGCVLSYGVVVDSNMVIKARSRLTTKRQSRQDGFSDSDWDSEATPTSPTSPAEPESMAEYVGENGCGFLWVPPTPDEDDSSDVLVEEWPVARKGDASADSSSELSSRAESPALMEPQEGPFIKFFNETLDSIRSGIAGQVPNDNTILMINASKYAYNVPMEEVPQAVVKAIMEGPENNTAEQASELLQYIKNAISYFEALLQHYVRGADGQMSVLQTLAECAEQQANVMFILPKVILLLYDADVVEEGPIVAWYQKLQGLDSGVAAAKRQDMVSRLKPVIEWLENAEEETSEEEENGTEFSFKELLTGHYNSKLHNFTAQLIPPQSVTRTSHYNPRCAAVCPSPLYYHCYLQCLQHDIIDLKRIKIAVKGKIRLEREGNYWAS